MPFRAVLKILISLSIVSLINAFLDEDEKVYINCDIVVMDEYYECVEQQQKVRMDKPVGGDLRVLCEKGWDLIESCYDTHIWKKIVICEVYTVEPVLHVTLADFDSGQLEFMCEGKGKFIKQFWNKKGAECFEKTKEQCVNSSSGSPFSAFDIIDYNNPRTCDLMMKFLNCLREHFDAACDDFGKKMVYTYYKSGFLKTPCGHYIKKKDKNTGLAIIYDQWADKFACSGGTVGAASASFPFAVFCLYKIMILY